MTAAVYMRVSSDEQRERGTIENQRAYAKKWVDLHDVKVWSYYAEDGVSGSIALPDRPEGSRLLSDAREGRFSTVLVYRLDRLGRDPGQILSTVAELEALEVRVQSMTEPFDTESPAGRLMLTMLSGFAGFERDSIVQRSVEGTNRLARLGTWLGGIVPYGYTTEGEGKDRRLVVADLPLPGLEMSEADVVRMIYRMAAVDGFATLRIADRLNELGVPPRYVTDGRKVGKRQQSTAGIWRPGRVRNMLVSTTYMGLHQYGKRSKKPGREIIERKVPAIVIANVWEAAQETLRRNRRFSLRNTRRKYLLRGLVKCGCCGLSYIGTHYKTVGGPDKTYYRCNGRSQARAMFGPNHDQICPSRALPGGIEELVWADIEAFLRDPGQVIHQVRRELTTRQSTLERTTETEALLQASLETKEVERGRVIALYRRGRIDDIDIDRQLTEIDKEVSAVRERLAELHSQESGVDDARNRLDSIESFLLDLNQRLEDGLDWDTKRRVVEELVEVVRVDPRSRRGGRSEARATVTYHFNTSIENRTGTGSSRPRA